MRNAAARNDGGEIPQDLNSQRRQKSLRVEFPGGNQHEPQIISFENWAHRGFFAEEVASAFTKLNEKKTVLTRSEEKSLLGSFLEFLDFVDPECSVESVKALTPKLISSFQKYLENKYPAGLRRKNVWLAARRLLLEMLCQGGHKNADPIHIQLTPWPKTTGRRAAVKKYKIDLRFTAVFPMPKGSPPQVIEFPEWMSREEFGLALVAAFTKLNAHQAAKTRITRRRQLIPFLKYLEQIDPAKKIAGPSDFNSSHARFFKEHLDSTEMIDRTKRKIWSTFRATLFEMARAANSEQMLVIHPTPWPGASRRGVHSEAMSIEQAGALLRACASEMQLTLERADRFGAHYPGIGLAELLPFMVVLAFFTNFNPDTLLGIKLSGIEPPYMGRIAIVADKGRSNSEQRATFPASDAHLCSPPVLIANLLRLTSGLRTKCRAAIREHLFVGLVLSSNSAHEIDSYENINSSTSYHHRKQLSKKYGLKEFSIQEIRTTGARLINALFGNDVKTAQTLLNHLSVDTTDGYTQNAAIAAEELSLADQMEKRNRFIRTKGRRDIRGRPRESQSAATPGFVCADPFNPPAELRQGAGLCSAYGACPTCPLAGTDHTCPTSLTSIFRIWVQLLDLRFSPNKDPYRWARVWKPRADAIANIWLPRFSEEVKMEAVLSAKRQVSPLPSFDWE